MEHTSTFKISHKTFLFKLAYSLRLCNAPMATGFLCLAHYLRPNESGAQCKYITCLLTYLHNVRFVSGKARCWQFSFLKYASNFNLSGDFAGNQASYLQQSLTVRIVSTGHNAPTDSDSRRPPPDFAPFRRHTADTREL